MSAALSALALVALGATPDGTHVYNHYDALTSENPLDTEPAYASSGALPSALPQPRAAMRPSFDIPLAKDPKVDLWIEQLNGRQRAWFERSLKRVPRFEALFDPVLDFYDLPRDLLYLAMIESGLSTQAYSVAHAAGPWQFIPATGRYYGLEVGLWVDERRDIERSSQAAARYLSRLYRQFDDWHLAWAAYNAGEGRVARAIRRSGRRDFWDLSNRGLLHRETKHYVPKLIAAAIVSKQPDKYGFKDVEYLAPLDWDVVTVTVSTDLKTIAKACGYPASEENLKFLNPALYRGITPPGRDYLLRVPVGSGFLCTEALGRYRPPERRTYRYHPVRRGDRIAKIAKRYHTTAKEIAELNKITDDDISIYDGIFVPVPYSKGAEVPPSRASLSFDGPPPYTPGSKRVRQHRVRRGESLWSIAKKYGVSIKRLRRANGMRGRSVLRIGQRLRIVGGR